MINIVEPGLYGSSEDPLGVLLHWWNLCAILTNRNPAVETAVKFHPVREVTCIVKTTLEICRGRRSAQRLTLSTLGVMSPGQSVSSSPVHPSLDPMEIERTPLPRGHISPGTDAGKPHFTKHAPASVDSPNGSGHGSEGQPLSTSFINPFRSSLCTFFSGS